MRPILYMTVGLPRVGKSTWSKRQTIPVVNPDSIRLSIHGKAFDLKHESLVWWTAKIMVESLFKAGHENVILDATNVTKTRRDVWISDLWERAFVVFPCTDLQTLKDRALFSDMPGLVPVIDRMAKEFEPITANLEKSCVVLDGFATPRILL